MMQKSDETGVKVSDEKSVATAGEKSGKENIEVVIPPERNKDLLVKGDTGWGIEFPRRKENPPPNPTGYKKFKKDQKKRRKEQRKARKISRLNRK